MEEHPGKQPPFCTYCKHSEWHHRETGCNSSEGCLSVDWCDCNKFRTGETTNYRWIHKLTGSRERFERVGEFWGIACGDLVGISLRRDTSMFWARVTCLVCLGQRPEEPKKH